MDPKEDKLNKLGVIPVFLKIIWAFNKHLVVGPFRGKNGPATYRRDISYAIIREVTGGFSVLQAQWLTPGTDEVYEKIPKSTKSNPNSVSLDNGAKGHWIGDPKAKYVLIYFHGGGYISAATPGHMKYQFLLQKAMAKSGHSFAVFSLSYTLCPHGIYPTQLRQAASALTYLLEHDKRDPSTILIGGDSAGGNLATVLLMHLSRPHADVPRINLSKPLRAALLISPWIAFDTTTEAFAQNWRSDYLTPRALNRASHAYIGRGKQHDDYSEPVRAGADWWRDVARTAVDEVMIWGGGGEILIDGIRTFAAKMADGFAEADGADGGQNVDKEGGGDAEKTEDVKKGRERAKYVETKKMAHEEMIIDVTLRIRKKGEGALAIEEWLSSKL